MEMENYTVNSGGQHLKTKIGIQGAKLLRNNKRNHSELNNVYLV